MLTDVSQYLELCDRKCEGSEFCYNDQQLNETYCSYISKVDKGCLSMHVHFLFVSKLSLVSSINLENLYFYIVYKIFLLL